MTGEDDSFFGCAVILPGTTRSFLETVMHSQMVRQNQTENAVLRATRRGGWLHFRPERLARMTLPFAVRSAGPKVRSRPAAIKATTEAKDGISPLGVAYDGSTYGLVGPDVLRFGLDLPIRICCRRIPTLVKHVAKDPAFGGKRCLRKKVWQSESTYDAFHARNLTRDSGHPSLVV